MKVLAADETKGTTHPATPVRGEVVDVTIPGPSGWDARCYVRGWSSYGGEWLLVLQRQDAPDDIYLLPARRVTERVLMTDRTFGNPGTFAPRVRLAAEGDDFSMSRQLWAVVAPRSFNPEKDDARSFHVIPVAETDAESFVPGSPVTRARRKGKRSVGGGSKVMALSYGPLHFTREAARRYKAKLVASLGLARYNRGKFLEDISGAQEREGY